MFQGTSTIRGIVVSIITIVNMMVVSSSAVAVNTRSNSNSVLLETTAQTTLPPLHVSGMMLATLLYPYVFSSFVIVMLNVYCVRFMSCGITMTHSRLVSCIV
jgi:hypothetical protein